MNARRGLATLGLSLAVHALLVLAIGFMLNRPSRIIRHIEVELSAAESGLQAGETDPAKSAATAVLPETPAEEPEPPPVPVPKPSAEPARRTVKPRIPKKQPVAPHIKKAEPKRAQPAEPSPDSLRKQGIESVAKKSAEAIENSEGGSSAAPAEDNSQGGGQKTDTAVLQAWLAAVRARIEAAKRYPFAAEQRRMQGIVTVNFSLSPAGRLLAEPSLSKSCGFSMLDTAALRAVQEAGPFPRFPGPAADMPGTLTVDVHFLMR